MFGLAFDYLLMAMAPSIAWLFVGRVIAGITASSDSAAGAYVADVSTPENRARNFGRFQAAANAGILLGPGILGAVFPHQYHAVFNPPVVQALNGVAWWGVTVFVWMAGIELDLKAVWVERRECVTTSRRRIAR